MDNDNIIRKLMFLSGKDEQKCKSAFYNSNKDFNKAMELLDLIYDFSNFYLTNKNSKLVCRE